MGRWTQFDEDGYRLPEGMKRVGYDSDTQRYYFRCCDGQLYQSVEGSEYGPLTLVNDEGSVKGVSTEGQDDDSDEGDLKASSLSATAAQSGGYRLLAKDLDGAPAIQPQKDSPYRTLFPFFLIVAVCVLLVWRLVIPLPASPSPLPCPKGSLPYWAKGGDSCWSVSTIYGCTLDTVRELNPLLDCDKLMRGDRICLPFPISK